MKSNCAHPDVVSLCSSAWDTGWLQLALKEGSPSWWLFIELILHFFYIGTYSEIPYRRSWMNRNGLVSEQGLGLWQWAAHGPCVGDTAQRSTAVLGGMSFLLAGAVPFQWGKVEQMRFHQPTYLSNMQNKEGWVSPRETLRNGGLLYLIFVLGLKWKCYTKI